ncbi:MAG: hypothetical protein LH477_12395 [Nocardioides sp.]|nr:hypothetical protein [Nocardioides sp.]
MSTDEHISQLRELRSTQIDRTSQLVHARVDRWQERIEDLELQVHLSAMDGSEQIALLSEKLRNQWERTRSEVDDASSAVTTAAETLRAGLEEAYRDVRDALVATHSTTTR